MKKFKIAIIGAGASGLMCADYLAKLKKTNVSIYVFEQMPTAGRKILWAGKTGLNISHAEPIEQFVSRYMPNDWLSPIVKQYNADWLQVWAKNLGIDTFVGSTGRIFPSQMKASPLLRAWLKELDRLGVSIFYRHKCVGIDKNILTLQREIDKNIDTFSQSFDAIILACGGLSYPKLGSTGDWQNWLIGDEITPMYASNVGICRQWSDFMSPFFGKALKRVSIWTDSNPVKQQGDIIISHYGLESGLIYKVNRDLRQDFLKNAKMQLYFDLLPDVSLDKILAVFNKNKKLSTHTLWQKVGLDKTKIALLRETTPKNAWQDSVKMANFIKHLCITFDDFRPIDEAISCGGGVKYSAMINNFQLKSNPYVFCCGEMLDWDAPTGGYLLTACFATGRACGECVVEFLQLSKPI